MHDPPTLSLTKPDDWHLHVRDGEMLRRVLPDTVRRFARAIIMPNLVPSTCTTEQAREYRERILATVPGGFNFQPLMTLFLTNDTSPAEIARAKASGFVYGVKWYPAVGVAGLHRLLAKRAAFDRATVAIVVAGMEGALPSVVGGLVSIPVIAVPTSVGYGAGAGGFAALLGMLTSCAAGVTVCNIDNGFGAAFAALRILNSVLAFETKRNDGSRIAPSPGLFFTGTDTGVGKTVVTASVARLLRRQRRMVRVCKPVASGADWIDGRWQSADTRCLAEAAGMTEALDRVTPWVFPDAVAPPVAARRCGVTLNIEDMVHAVRQLSSEPDAVVLVEGVGGLLCPLTERETVANLAVALGLPLILVVRPSLGTLNHTLLTLEAARQRGLVVAGIVVNETQRPETLAEETNVEELSRRIDVPLLAVVPYQHDNFASDVPALGSVDSWHLSQQFATGTRLCRAGLTEET